MNETRFIELLNLYVDQQLSAQEAAELEAEIQKNPSRHRTYQQYCRMQRACAQLFEHERSAAPASSALGRALADADRKVVEFPTQPARRSIWPVGFSVAALAAAACVAFVVVQQTNPAGPALEGSHVAQSETPLSVQKNLETAIAAVPANENRKTATLASTEEFKRVFTVQPLRSLAIGQADGLFITASSEDAQPLDWTRAVQLKPLRKVSLEEFAFDQRTGTGLNEPAITQNPEKVTDDRSVEMVTFEFTK